PNPNFTGTASYDYTITDGNGGTSTATVTISVTPVNDAPTANNDTASTAEDTPVSIPLATLAGNDTDQDGDTLTVTAVGNAVGGTVTIVGGNAVFTPDPNFTGAATFEYTVSDGNGGADTATVTVNVTAAQDAPKASDDSFSTAEDTPVVMTTASLLANDTDPDAGDTLTVTAVSNPVGGTVALVGGNVTFTPNPNFTGTGSYDYTISDGNGGTSTATVTVNVAPQQDAPTAGNDTASTTEDTPVSIPLATLAGNDTDPDGDTLTVTAVGNAVGGTVVIVGGNAVFTPDPNFTGSATFEYTVSDGNGGTDTATVTVNVTAAQDAPTANADSFSTAEDTPVTMTTASLLANDTDPDAGDTLSVTGVANPVGGTVSLVGGNVTFTPNPNFTGTASYDYTVSDGNGGTSTATVTITVTPQQDAPTANNDTAGTTEDTAVAIPLASLLGNDTDPDAGDTLTVTAVGNPVGGTVSIVGGNAVFTPNPNFTGPATFEYTISDGNGGTDTDTVTVNVAAAQDAPTANGDSFSTAEETPVTMTTASLLANDTDPDTGDTLAVTGVSNPVGGTITLVGGNVTFTPAPNFTGAASYDYTISDGNGGTSTATVTVNVTPQQDAPTANNDTAATTEDTPVSISLAALAGNDTDPDGDTLTVTAVGNPVGGTVTIVGGNAVFTPNPNFTGAATFEYTLGDGNGGTDTATVTVNVVAVQDPPAAINDVVSTAEDTPVVIPTSSLLANDVDPDIGDVLAVSSVGGAIGGTVSLAGGNVTFTPDPNFTGAGSFTYTISDGQGGVSSASVTVNVAPVQDPPSATNDSVTTAEDTPVTISPATLTGNDSDADGDTLGVTAVGSAIGGSVAIVGGNIVFTPDPDFTGTGSFVYTVSDGQGGTDTATVSVDVTPVQDAPSAANDVAATTEDTPVSIPLATLLGNDADPDAGDTLTVVSVGNAVGGTVTIVGGNAVFTPAPDFIGTATFDYTISDGQGGSDTATVTVTVAAAQDAPTASADIRTTAEDTPVTLTTASLLANDTDPDAGDTLTVTGVSNAVGGTVSLVGGNVTFTPNPDFTGAATFDYSISDGQGGTSTATVTVNVTPAQDPPSAVNDSVSTTEDTPISIAPATLLGNDSDPDAGDTLGVMAVGSAIGGSVAIVGGNIVFTPDPDFTGAGSFQYVVSDGNGGTDTATVTVNVTAAQDAPTANADGFSTSEDTPVVMTTASLLANDTDPDAADTLSVTGVGNPVGGTVSLAGGNVTFTPNANFTGTASYQYTISDGNGGTSTATVTVNVTPVQDAPTANNDTATTAEDTPVSISLATLAGNDTDPDAGNTLTVLSVGNPVGGTVVIVGGNAVFTPNPNFTGAATFEYTISDGNGGTDTATVTVNVTAVNDAPTANDDGFSTAEDTPVVMTTASLLANDTDPDTGNTLAVTAVSNPVGGTVSLVGGNVTFTPNPNFTGTASYDYTISDGNGG
ncbi:Ig-like domain-containing protein, partial [Ramlibacter sp. PS3R-8]|uniref:beta strand repeat-containing protein n=1 Tax=Ramlibacter sp. PS3R-8 TaxID=3133437 RepID=UPI0030B551EA